MFGNPYHFLINPVADLVAGTASKEAALPEGLIAAAAWGESINDAIRARAAGALADAVDHEPHHALGPRVLRRARAA